MKQMIRAYYYAYCLASGDLFRAFAA